MIYQEVNDLTQAITQNSKIKELDNQIRVQLNKKDNDSQGFVEIIFAVSCKFFALL